MPEVAQEKTGLGNYFVANYPPFSFWKPDHLAQARAALEAAPSPQTPLGLYLHIPFCRKRCKFCYFRVYTDKNARDVESYLSALLKEVELYSRLPVGGGRQLQYIYFGGGTPSFLSAAQLRFLMEGLKRIMPWDRAEEVTFECEPGTLQQHKLETLKELGVTRLSLGIENFDDEILESNGRAHLSGEIYRAYGWARELNFDQLNIDLIAGMVGEHWDNWKQCVQKTIALDPDSVTIYQMELPFNTVFSQELQFSLPSPPLRGSTAGDGDGGEGVAPAEALLPLSPSPPTPLPRNGGEGRELADWPTKRAWVNYAFGELLEAGYEVSSAYTLVKDRRRCRFVYRDSLWHGADMFGTGVASFGHVNGVHVQNVDAWERYIERLDQGELPLGRALPAGPRALLIREMILQLKTGRLESAYFRDKFGANILEVFAGGFHRLAQAGYLQQAGDGVELTRTGLLQVDRLLPEFFEPEHRGTRYT